jgi:uncharacterized protein (TIGR03435 family)
MRTGRFRCVLGFIVLTRSLAAPTALAQDRPSFEVASVKPAPELRSHLAYPAPRPPRAISSGRFDATATLRVLIAWAFHPEFPMEGSFRELDDVFVIAAKAAGPVLLASPREVGPINQMLQSLLVERFKLRVRWETRSFPVYALRRTSSEQPGRNLKRIDPTCAPGYPENLREAPDGCASLLTVSKGQVRGFVTGMADFARFLSTYARTRVVDDTGLVGRFELSTAFDPRSETDYGSPAEKDLPSLRDALRDDLGFKLESERRDFPVLIVEHVEQPTAN